MGYDYSVEGTVRVTPPIPFPALLELTQGPDLPIFCLAPGVDDPDAAGPWSDMVGVWALVPEDVPLDQAQPITVSALAVRHISKSTGIHQPLARFVRLCLAAGHEVVSELEFHGEEGERGEIQVTPSGDIQWVEISAPGRKPACW
ncbi:hypothetical protein ACF053_30100 [Streptomyces kanasensis]|uniref:hypothetical protein n=1 Tax=Streptomyces kanasensis TaxID=936756 RepID=UPI0037018D91